MYDNDKRAHWQNEGVSRQTVPEAWTKVDLGYGFCKKCNAWRGTLGLEPDFNLFVTHLCDVFEKLKRPLREDGSLWVNLGDTYYTKSGSGFHFDRIRGNPEGSTNIHMANAIRGQGLLPSKCLVLAPFRFAVEMCNRGWILRNVIIWHKNNVIPTSAKDRFTVDFEYLFFFVQNRKYYFEKQLEPYKTAPKQQYRPNAYPDKTVNKGGKSTGGQGIHDGKRTREEFFKNAGRNKRTVWKIPEKEQKPYAMIEPEFRNPIIEFRDLPEHDKIRTYLQEWRKEKGITIKEIEEHFKNQAGHHWFETNGSYPSRENWIELKELLEFDDLYDYDMTTIYEKSGMKQVNLSGRNKRTVWNINTKPCKEAHFAVFPPELVKIPIQAGCPEYICTKCGKPREKIINKNPINVRSHKLHKGKGRDAADGKNPDLMVSGFARTGVQFEYEYEEVGYTDCGCGAEFKPGIVLDPFGGTNTTGRVARSLKRDWIAFDVSEEYCEIANKLLLQEIKWDEEDSGDDMGDMMLI